jgi:hypothetical protein
MDQRGAKSLRVVRQHYSRAVPYPAIGDDEIVSAAAQQPATGRVRIAGIDVVIRR